MGKKIRKFPSIKKNNNFSLIREIELVYTELQENTFKNIKFINREDQLDFNESLKLFANFMVTGNKKFIEEAHLKSPYNIFANIFMISEQKKSPLEVMEDIEELKFETVKYPIVGNPNFKNDFNRVVIEHLISFYIDNGMYSTIPRASLIWINLEKGELKLDSILTDTIIAYLKIDSADKFYSLYKKLSPASQLDEFVQLAKLIFDIRKLDDEEVVETMATLKHINPKIERLLDLVSNEKLYIKTDLPIYKSIGGYYMDVNNNTLEVSLFTKFSFKHNEKISIPITELPITKEKLKEIKAITFIYNGHIYKTISLE